jgi:hypothetical protein
MTRTMSGHVPPEENAVVEEVRAPTTHRIVPGHPP